VGSRNEEAEERFTRTLSARIGHLRCSAERLLGEVTRTHITTPPISIPTTLGDLLISSLQHVVRSARLPVLATYLSHLGFGWDLLPDCLVPTSSWPSLIRFFIKRQALLFVLFVYRLLTIETQRVRLGEPKERSFSWVSSIKPQTSSLFTARP